MKKRLLWILAGIILVLVITNPTPYEFKSYSQLKEGSDIISARTSYYGIFSIYQFRNTNSSNKEKYLGVFKTFFFLSKEEPPPMSDLEKAAIAEADSIAAAAQQAADAAAAAAAYP